MVVPRRRRLSRVAVNRILGVPAARVVVPSAGPPVGSPGLVSSLITRDPSPGRFYQAGSRDGDGFTKIARDALDAYQQGLGDARETRLAYMECISAGSRWNARNYGSTYTDQLFPSHLLFDGYGLARAFEPWHEDAAAALRGARWPRRTIDESGARIARGSRERALLWLPAIEAFQYHDGHWLPVCVELDPPAVLLDALRSPTPGRSPSCSQF